MRPGQTESFRVRALDANGFTVEEIKDVSRCQMGLLHSAHRQGQVDDESVVQRRGQAGGRPTKPLLPPARSRRSVGDLKGYMRGRILPYLPIKQDFEWASLTETNAADNAMFAYPPLPWIGARFKFEIRDLNGNKVLAKTMDNPFFQRATVFIGDPSTKNYTIEADVMSEGNKRMMSEVGLVNQRYYIVLKGASKQLEVNSTQELFRHAVPFRCVAECLVPAQSPRGCGGGRLGCHPRQGLEKRRAGTGAWTIEVPHKHAHESGSPGLFAFAPQKRVYIDNITVTPNEK